MDLYFETMSDFFAMGGHGLYVWLCYGAGFLVLSVAFVQPRIKRRAIIKELAQRQRRNEAQSR